MKVLAELPAVCCPPGGDPLPRAERELLARRFKALADPARVGIVNLLSTADEVCVCELTGPLGLSQPTVSHHLRILREAELIAVSRRGTWSYYRLERTGLAALTQVLAGATGAAPALA